ncbi:hypothetical protein pb186bvf_001330 [Paramecium bursaria]
MLYHSQSPLKVQSIRHILHNSAILIQPTQIQTAYTEKHIQPFLGQSRKASSRVLVKRAYESQELIKTSHSPAKSQDRTDRSMSRELNQGNTGQIVTIYFGERKYIGQTKKIYKHGIGTLYDKNSNIIYEGQWQDDKYHGLGTLNNNDKSEWKQYVGEFFYGTKIRRWDRILQRWFLLCGKLFKRSQRRYRLSL